MLDGLRKWLRHHQFQEGSTLSRFIARDVRRDILVVSAARAHEGIITGRVRTTNLLYVARGLVPPSDFEPARELRLEEMWHWSGQSWGGLPNGSSIVSDTLGKQGE